MATTRSIDGDGAREIRALHSTPLAGEHVPTKVLLAPWGPVESSNGSFVVDEEAVQLAIEAFETHATDLPIDYEHQTLGGSYAAPNGQAPAAGWVKRLVGEAGVGLLAEIEWTDQARKLLASKEYRYLSPVAIVRKNDRKLVSIHSAALTNKPAIVGMRPIVNRIAIDTDAEPDSALERLRAELALPADTEPEEVLVAASRRLVDLARAERERRIEERIHDAMRAGKLVEAQRAWAEALVAKEEGLFEEWLRTAPVVVRPGVVPQPNSHDITERRHHAAAVRARSEFRSNRFLSCLTSEEAFVADALRSLEN